MTERNVAIIGATGALGFGLAIRLGAVGVPVVIGSRDRGRAKGAAGRARDIVKGANVEGATNEEAAASARLVVLSVPYSSQAHTLKALSPALGNDQILVDATVPLAAATGGKATRTLGVWQGSAAQQAEELVPAGVSVVSALHTVSASLLGDLSHPLDQDVLLCGDSKLAKQRVAGVINRVDGLRCIDCGGLEVSRIAESLTAMMIGINIRYKTHAGIKITGVPSIHRALAIDRGVSRQH